MTHWPPRSSWNDALADVVADDVAGDRLAGSVGVVEVARTLTDDDAELHFPVQFGGTARLTDRIVRADQRVRRLGEQDGLVGHRLPSLRRVVAVVQPDAQDLMRPRDRRPDALAGEPLHDAVSDALGHDDAQRVEAIGEQRTVDVASHLGHVDVRRIVDADHGLLDADQSDAHEVHEVE